MSVAALLPLTGTGAGGQSPESELQAHEIQCVELRLKIFRNHPVVYLGPTLGDKGGNPHGLEAGAKWYFLFGIQAGSARSSRSHLRFTGPRGLARIAIGLKLLRLHSPVK